jgi:type IV pilus assembly protein PilV
MDGNTMIHKNNHPIKDDLSRKKALSPDHGFTLIEVMIAMVVLLMGMLGVMAMQYYSIGGNSSSRELRIATSLAQEMVEQLKGTPYANLAGGTDNPLPVFATPGADAPTVQATSGNVNYTRSWWILPNCTELAGAAPGNVNACLLNGANAPACSTVPDAAVPSPASAIRTRTCWVDVNGTNHSVTLDTIRWDETVVP